LNLVADNVAEQVSRVAAAIAARMALGAAAWQLVHGGICFQVGNAEWHDVGWNFTTGGHSGGFNFRGKFVLLCPQFICRAGWQTTPGGLFDSDLYLQRLESAALSPGVTDALRISLECFRHDLYVPCVAMLGAASEAVWIATGTALARHFGQHDKARKLHASLEDRDVSTASKIAKVCNFFELPICDDLRAAAMVNRNRLRSIQQWSDQVRESRNVLHWGAKPTVPNTYEKVAILLMDAVSEFTDLRALAKAAGG